MLRFVLLTFAFLGWAFYEMSGGSSFDPAEVREARLAAAAQAEAEAEAKAQARAAAAEAARRAATEEIADVSAPKVFVDTDPPQTGQAATAVASLSEADSTETENKLDAQADGALPQPTPTSVVLPSLIASDDTAAAQTPAVQTEDIRTVSGNRVNVRGGPGTDYGVVTRLVRGDAVRILEDDGNGWVRLEPVNGGPGGWMADFLLIGG